jgi:hypothetical protein
MNTTNGDIEILPIDDLRHCPEWLRISDGVAKTPFTGCSNVEKSGTKQKPRMIYALIKGQRVFAEPMMVGKLSQEIGVKPATISACIREDRNTREGYRFEVAE